MADPVIHNGHPIDPKFCPSPYSPGILEFLVGDADHKHFYVNQNEIYCVRATCEGCTLRDQCEFVEEEVQSDPLPNVRRGIGEEQRPFLVLDLVTDPKDLPEGLIDPLTVNAMDECNLHFLPELINNQYQTQIYKGQVRFYGTEEEFHAHPIAQHCNGIITKYEGPKHYITSVDFSSIEPVITTINSREEHWVKAFIGTPKTIFRKVEFSTSVSLPKYVIQYEDQLYCHLTEPELDKADYADQCAKCQLNNSCIIKKNYIKQVKDDWHGVNTYAFYSDKADEWDKSKNPDNAKKAWKGYRDISKIVGLALTYGGTAWTVSKNMQTSVEQAQVRIDNFFRKLTTLNNYMTRAKVAVEKNGYITTLFDRRRDVRFLTESEATDFKQKRKDVAQAQRHALNHPIQSLAGDFLKLAMIETGNIIRTNNLNPLYKSATPQTLKPGSLISDVILSILMTIHDENDLWVRQDQLHHLLPIIQTKMQIPHILKQLDASYITLEVDVEYDPKGLWNSRVHYPSALIYLNRYLTNPNSLITDPEKGTRMIIEQDPIDKDPRSNLNQPVPEVTRLKYLTPSLIYDLNRLRVEQDKWAGKPTTKLEILDDQNPGTIQVYDLPVPIEILNQHQIPRA